MPTSEASISIVLARACLSKLVKKVIAVDSCHEACGIDSGINMKSELDWRAMINLEKNSCFFICRSSTNKKRTT